MPFSVALSAAAGAVGAFFTTSKVLAFVIKAGILFGASYLLRPRGPDSPSVPEQTHTETFASGPARWVLGRQRVGGVICFWGEDWDVKGTERRNEVHGGADDLHLVIAISEGDCDAIEAVFVGSDRFDVKFKDDAKTQYVRREEGDIPDTDPDQAAKIALLPIELDPGVNAYFDEARNQWRESESLESRVLDEENNTDDAETIRRASLAGAVSVIPYLDGNTTDERWQSLRRYTDDLQNEYLRENEDLNNPQKATPFADQWTTDHKLTGIAGVHVRLRQWVKHNFDQRVFKGSTPDIGFLVRGLRITFPDPAPDAQADSTRTEWTENAAAIRYWWHTERRGFPSTAIDHAAFVAAYNACDQKIVPDRPATWPDGEQPEWSKDDSVWGFGKYSINGVLNSGDKPAQIEEEFDRQWQGQVVEDGGRLFYYPGIDRPATGIVNGEDLLEYPQIAPAPALADRINAVTLSMRQSAYHDYNTHALNEIVDEAKRSSVDHDFHLPQDLGEWRWVINPASAYALAIINLRRARYATTISLMLPPGDADDPVKYLRMTPGQVYLIDIPTEGIESRRMTLQSKTIGEDMKVEATFLDSPTGLYESSYELPALAPRPPYTPSRVGARPPKPTGLHVRSSARTSSDGSVQFRIVATADNHALRKVWRLAAGEDEWTATTENDTHVFEVNVPRQIMEVTVRHVDKTGVESFPAKVIFTPGYEEIVLPTPRWTDAFPHGGTLRMVFAAEEFTAGISGVEVRYTRAGLDTTTELPVLTATNWLTEGDPLTIKPVQLLRGQAIVAEAQIRESGRYNLFARFVSNVSGAEAVRGPISAAWEIAIDIGADAVSGVEQAPVWNVTSHNLFKWDSKYGNTKGESLMLPAYTPSSNDVDDIPFDVWNGYVETSAVAAEPYARWPFGRAPGFGFALDSTGRNASTGLLQESNGGTSTWLLTQPIDLGSLRRVEVRGHASAFAPGTDSVSNITFGGTRLPSQRWRYNRAITAITMPPVTAGVSPIAYELTGLPAGLQFNPITRVLSGTPSISDASGEATYTATDSLGGSVSLDFAWNVAHALGAPSAPTGLALSGKTRTTLSIGWTASALTNYYEVQYSLHPSGTVTTVVPVWATSLLITGLTAATNYRFRVRSHNGAGASDAWTAWVQGTTDTAATIPSTPTGLAASSTNDRAVVADWDTVAGATTYELQWKLTTAASYSVSDFIDNIPASIKQIGGLTASTAYHVRVRARNEVGASAWSSAVTMTTVAQSDANFTVTITDHSYGDDDPRPFFRIVTSNPGTPEMPDNGTEIEVTLLRDEEDGGNLRLSELIFARQTTSPNDPYNPLGPFLYYGVGPGHSYQIRVRKNFTPLSGIGLSQYTAWRTINRVFTGVPHQPLPPRNIDTVVKPTSMQLRCTTVPTATKYRLRYWKASAPAAPLQRTVNAPNAGTTFIINLQNLDDEETYHFTLGAYNSHGWSLDSREGTSTLPKEYRTPGAITGLRVSPLTSTSLILAWTEDEDAESYQIQHGGTPNQRQVGITGNVYEFGNLTPNTHYRMRIRGYQPLAPSGFQYGPWRTFTQTLTPSASHGSNPYRFTSPPLTLTRRAQEPRRIDWTFRAPSAAGVTGLQLRYRQPTQESLNDGVVTDWVIGFDSIFSVSFANDGDTYTGSFDPGFSGRYWEVQARVLVAANSGSPFDAGFSEWGRANHSDGGVQGVFQNGAKPMTAPTPRVRQRQTDDDETQVVIDWVPNTEDFETPASSGATSRNEIRISFNGTQPPITVRQIGALPYPVVPSNKRQFRIWSYNFNDRNRRYTGSSELTFKSIYETIGIQPYYHVRPLRLGERFSVQIARHEKNRPTVTSAAVEHTIVSPDQAADFTLGDVTFRSDIVSGRNVTFSWSGVGGASGYEVTLYEDELGQGTTTTTIVQSGTEREWTKVGGINEHFSIRVRVYTDRFGQRSYSTGTTRHYQAISEVGKITQLRAEPSGADLILTWKALPGDNDDFRYERSFSDDDGATWSSPFTIPTSDWSDPADGHPIIEHTMVNNAHADTLLRLRAYKLAADGTTKIYSNSYTMLHWLPSGTIADGNFRPINALVAGSRYGNVLLDWTAPNDEGNHPEASRYRIEARGSLTGAWTLIQNNIAGTVTAWQTTNISSAVARWFRVRPETSEINGPWTTIAYTPDTSVSVGTVSATGTATYTTMTASWAPVANAQEYELQYKSGTGGFGGAIGAVGSVITRTGIQSNTITIGDEGDAAKTPLSAGQHYQIRVRGVAGGSSGAYSSTVDIDTLAARNLPAPAGVTLSSSGSHVRVSWDAVAEATGYFVTFDAKLSSDAVYHQYIGVVQRNVNSITIEISRLEFGPTLAYEEIDLRVRVKANFFDSPTSNFSPYQAIRWAPGEFVAPPGGDDLTFIAANTGSALSLSNPHRVSGVNGQVGLGLATRQTAAFHPLPILYNVATGGNYTFRATYVGPGGAAIQTQLRLFAGNRVTQLAVGTSDADGVASVSANLTGGIVYLVHYLVSETTVNPSQFVLQITGPPVQVTPLTVDPETHSIDVREGGSNSLTFALNRIPDANTTITIASSNTDVTTSPSSVTFTRTNWSTPRTLTIYAALDADTNDGAASVTFSGTPLATAVLVRTIESTAARLIATSSATLQNPLLLNEGGTRRLRFRLSHAPSVGRTVTLTPSISQSGNSKRLSVSPSSLTINSTNWDDATHVFTYVASTDAGGATESGQLSVTVTTTEPSVTWETWTGYFRINDISRADYRVVPSATTLEVVEGSTATLNVNLSSTPITPVTIFVESTDTTALTVSPSSLTFTASNWSVNQTVTLTGVTDSDTSDESARVEFKRIINSVRTTVAATAVTIKEPVVATPELILNPTSLIVINEQVNFNIDLRFRLSTRPTGLVRVAITSGNSRIEGPTGPFNLTQDNWSDEHRVGLRVLHDFNAVDTIGVLSFAASGGGYDNVNASITVQAIDPLRVLPFAATFSHHASSFQSNYSASGQHGSFSPVLEGRRQVSIFNWQVYGSSLTIEYRHNGSLAQPASITGRMESPNSTDQPVFISSVNRSNPATGVFTIALPDFMRSLPFVRFSPLNIQVGSGHTSGITITMRPSLSGDVPTSNSGAGGAAAQAKAAVALGTGEGTAERVNLSHETYEHVEQPALPASVRPAFFGHIPTMCWQSGVAIDEYQLPPAGNGLPPYTITATGLPAGITFDADDRTLSGTPTDTAPLGGTATFTLTDTNGNTDVREVGWAIGSGVPASWSEFGGGFGQYNNPFQMTCTTKGNARPFYYIQGGTNAADIASDATGARSKVIWLKCPTTHPHTARLTGADAPDYDLVVKVGDDFYFSDTDDAQEMVSVPGHHDGALVGIYRYEPTTIATGVNNTGDPLVLEWFPEVEHLPTESGAVGLAASASAERGANAAGSVPGASTTEIFVLHRNDTTGAWTRNNTALGTGWVDVGVNARQIRFEVHLRSWENRALRRFTTFHRDKD